MHQGAGWPNGNPLFVSLPSVIPDADELYITKEGGIPHEPHALILAGDEMEGCGSKERVSVVTVTERLFLVTFF